MTEQQRIYDGARAREILDNEVFQQVWADLEKELIEQWKNTPARDEEGREKIWSLLKLMHKLKDKIQVTLDSGKLSEVDRMYKQSIIERAKDVIL